MFFIDVLNFFDTPLKLKIRKNGIADNCVFAKTYVRVGEGEWSDMFNIVEVKDLKNKYKDTEAVKDVNFNVSEGEIFGFLGPNGAGKSTTINMLSTIIQPSGGTATVNGFDNVKKKNKVRESIGLIFQENTLYLKN